MANNCRVREKCSAASHYLFARVNISRRTWRSWRRRCAANGCVRGTRKWIGARKKKCATKEAFWYLVRPSASSAPDLVCISRRCDGCARRVGDAPAGARGAQAAHSSRCHLRGASRAVRVRARPRASQTQHTRPAHHGARIRDARFEGPARAAVHSIAGKPRPGARGRSACKLTEITSLFGVSRAPASATESAMQGGRLASSRLLRLLPLVNNITYLLTSSGDALMFYLLVISAEVC